MRGVATTRPEPVVGNKHCPLNQKAVGLPGPRPAQTYRKVVEEVSEETQYIFDREHLNLVEDEPGVPYTKALAAYALTLLERAEKAGLEYGVLQEICKKYNREAHAARLVVEAVRAKGGWSPDVPALIRAYDDTLKGEKEPLEINTETVTGALDAIRKAVKKL